MDDLEFRRHAYGEPSSQAEDFIQHINLHPKDAALVKELNDLDAKLTQALKIDVSDDLADKILLRQHITQHQAQRKSTGYLVAMAASIAFVVGISFSLLQLTPVNLSENALAHVYHEPRALSMDQNLAFEDVNFKLAGLTGMHNAKFVGQPGKIYFTTYCDFQGVQGLHLVMQGAHGKVTVFIVPIENRMVMEEVFADNKYQGLGFQAAGSYMLLVGEQAQDLNQVKSDIENTFI
ncbi:conserved hypothetical protein [Shewanella denitrificans OS217]|jgi:hypothetical protein|uniref:DUF3379 domain-containing protein n=1 Tax=Shewanella denitrificans (strain OS217 / ATCC BAA-1090 / DSM 15013) TaxID=318161 RepID=Q12P20_SHEDO|nr:DUF3379 domain-containing protein [Shewanella denitrificans]ABE54806.1 conserved hypothetical protein [Shewanella denitrificans OS217]